MRPLKHRVKEGYLTIGTWLTFSSAQAAEVLTLPAPDWLALDMEHGFINPGDMEEMIRVISSTHVAPLVRVPKVEEVCIKQALDAGAQGIIAPMVNSREQVEEFLNFSTYPPVGKRSFGLSRAHRYGRGFKQHIDKNINETIRVIQIEHIDAVENIDEIFSVKNIDAAMIGPYDLTGSMGIPGQFDDKAYKEVLEKIFHASEKYSLSLGYHQVEPLAYKLENLIKEGYSFLAYGTDFMFLDYGLSEGLKKQRDK